MGRRKKKKFIDRWWVKFLMVAAAIFLIGEAGMKIWSSEAVQTRFVYMWPYQNEILEYGRILAENGVGIRSIESLKEDFESYFIRLIKGEGK